MIRKQIDATIDRTKGEEMQVSAKGLSISGFVPFDLEVSFSGQSGQRFPMTTFRDIAWPDGFTSVWVFHSAVITGLVGVGPNFNNAYLPTLDFLFYNSQCERPAQSQPPNRPQIRAADGLAAFSFEDFRRAQNFSVNISSTVGPNAFLNAPTSNYTLRLFAYRISLDNNATISAPGAVNFNLTYQANVFTWRCFVPSVAGTALGNVSSGWTHFGQNGLLMNGVGFNLTCGMTSALVTGAALFEVLYSWDRQT